MKDFRNLVAEAFSGKSTQTKPFKSINLGELASSAPKGEHDTMKHLTKSTIHRLYSNISKELEEDSIAKEHEKKADMHLGNAHRAFANVMNIEDGASEKHPLFKKIKAENEKRIAAIAADALN